MKVNNMKINVIDGPDDKYYSKEFGAAAVAVFAQNQCFDALIYIFLLKMTQNYFFLIVLQTSSLTIFKKEVKCKS